jgi:chromosome segregation ATPase
MKLRTPLLNAAADDGSENGGAAPVNPAEALAKIEDRTLPMGQRLSVAAAALRGIDPTNQLAAVQEQLTQAQARSTELEGQLTTAQADLATVRAELTAREQDVTDLQTRNVELEQTNADLTAREQDLEARADAKAAEKVASLGFPAARLPAANGQQATEGEEKIAELREQLAKENDPGKRGKIALEIKRVQAAMHGKN